MGITIRLDEARSKRHDPLALFASELRRVAMPIAVDERRKVAAEFRERAEGLEADAADALHFDAEEMLHGLARSYRQLSRYLDDTSPAA